MKKRLVSIVLVLCLIFSSNVFAYRWVDFDGGWYVYNDEKQEYLSNCLLDVGDGVYYLDKEGRMVTSWWRNDETGEYYFFSNKNDKDYGSMVFGIHMIDGYYHYFNDNGTLATAGDNESYKKVYAEFWADQNGYLYYLNQILRDTSKNKSEYYTNTIYYDEPALNNEFLATKDTTFKRFEVVKVEKANGSASGSNGENKKHTVGSDTSGGTNYWVDDQGKVHSNDQVADITAEEKYGPMNINK